TIIVNQALRASERSWVRTAATLCELYLMSGLKCSVPDEDQADE
ncbi:unnamed protein product, partial [marine sediment metagenome]